MFFLFSPWNVTSVLVAGVLYFVVSQRLLVAAPKAGTATKVAAGLLVLGPVADFATPFLNLYEYSQVLHALLRAGFWGCLAWAVWALLQEAPSTEVR
ncbi:MAG: hypothetical protein AB1938_17000 [Myxococcota bacterium]